MCFWERASGFADSLHMQFNSDYSKKSTVNSNQSQFLSLAFGTGTKYPPSLLRLLISSKCQPFVSKLASSETNKYGVVKRLAGLLGGV